MHCLEVKKTDTTGPIWPFQFLAVNLSVTSLITFMISATHLIDSELVEIVSVFLTLILQPAPSLPLHKL